MGYARRAGCDPLSPPVQYAYGCGAGAGRVALCLGWLWQSLHSQIHPRWRNIATWGGPGHGPGDFSIVHNIGCDRTGRLLVCDRENDRIQLFDPDGNYLEEWTGLEMPGDVWITPYNTIYVAEQGGSGHVSVWSPDGRLISRFSGAPGGVLEAPHGICVDAQGSIYVAKIGGPGRGQRLQKFARV